MADGPRCKRRKQANPRRNNVTSYGAVAERGSDSDDEDKLHIVEEEASLPDGADGDGKSWDEVREEGASEGEEDGGADALVEEMLQQGDTAVIYPEAPEDEPHHGTPDASGHDENGTPDAFSQLLTCPYCARGYKRYTSLKEHIKYRHEKSQDNFSCSQCSYTFAHRAQLEKHMTAHKAGRDQRHISQSGGNRKFKCTECGKAFKYKHHLKEHLRIHSGEKPYECSNCKKRFSHSGSYSSHISSKKCVGPPAVNGRPRPAHAKPSSRGPSSPASPAALPKLEHGKPLQEQLPLHQIKSEPLDYEYKPAPTAAGAQAGGLFGGAAAVQALVLPTVGLVSPININLADLQSVLKVAVDGDVLRQVLESNARGPLQNQQLISAISLPIVGQDGSAKIIINYSLDPSQAPLQLTAHNLKTEPQARHRGAPGATEKLPEDLTVRAAARGQGTKEEDGEAGGGEKRKTTKACLLCDECPGGLETLHALKHCKREGLRISATALEKSQCAVAALLADGEPGSEQPKNLLSLLKAYFALNAEPTREELAKISDSVSLPAHVLQKWFDKMQEGQISLGAPTPPSEEEEEEEEEERGCESRHSGHPAQASPTEASPAEASGAHCSPAAPSPLNLTAGAQSADGPLDLSLPKRDDSERPSSKAQHYPSPPPASANQEEPLNLTCTKRDSSPTLVPLYASLPSANHLGIMTTQQPTLVAIAEQSRAPCLRALHTSQTLLIPQLAYTYTTTASSPAGTETQEKTVHLNRIKEERQDTSSEGISTMDDQNDSDSAPPRKKMRKTESGMYACDLCDKIFQKSSSLLRHKYEHTGKRPHECGICTKAFKHKHHLIEHMRLHSGEKPYQCDKCGKRFSHSGSYSQHMNHRYSYCKKEDQAQGGGRESPEEDAEPKAQAQVPTSTLPHPDSDERGSSTRDEEESEEEEEEEDTEVQGVLDMSDIQVVQIGDEGGDEEKCEEGEEEGERDHVDGEVEEDEEGVERVVVGEEEEESMEVEVKQEDKEPEEEEQEAEQVVDRTQEDMQENSETERGAVGEAEAVDQGEGLTSEQAAEERGAVGEAEAVDQGKGLTSEQAVEESGERAEKKGDELIEEKPGETNGNTVVEPEADVDSKQRI